MSNDDLDMSESERRCGKRPFGGGQEGGADSTRRDILLLVAISPKQYK